MSPDLQAFPMDGTCRGVVTWTNAHPPLTGLKFLEKLLAFLEKLGEKLMRHPRGAFVFLSLCGVWGFCPAVRGSCLKRRCWLRGNLFSLLKCKLLLVIYFLFTLGERDWEINSIMFVQNVILTPVCLLSLTCQWTFLALIFGPEFAHLLMLNSETTLQSQCA